MGAWGTMPKKLRGAAWALSGEESTVIPTATTAATTTRAVAIEALFILMLISSAEPRSGTEVAAEH